MCMGNTVMQITSEQPQEMIPNLSEFFLLKAEYHFKVDGSLEALLIWEQSEVPVYISLL